MSKAGEGHNTLPLHHLANRGWKPSREPPAERIVAAAKGACCLLLGTAVSHVSWGRRRAPSPLLFMVSSPWRRPPRGKEGLKKGEGHEPNRKRRRREGVGRERGRERLCMRESERERTEHPVPSALKTARRGGGEGRPRESESLWGAAPWKGARGLGGARRSTNSSRPVGLPALAAEGRGSRHVQPAPRAAASLETGPLCQLGVSTSVAGGCAAVCPWGGCRVHGWREVGVFV